MTCCMRLAQNMCSLINDSFEHRQENSGLCSKLSLGGFSSRKSLIIPIHACHNGKRE